MSDRYVHLVNTGFTATLAKRLGLPRPAELLRLRPGSTRDVTADGLPTGPVLVLGTDADGGPTPDADTVAATLAAWGLDVRRRPDTPVSEGGPRVSAVVVVLTDLAHPDGLAAPARALSGVLRSLAPGARVVTVSRAAATDDAPALAAARNGVDGFLRSLAKELRSGATANGVVLGADAQLDSPGTLGTLRFFLSRRSAFVAGQLLTVANAAGSVPEDWARPLAGRVAVVTGGARGIGAAIARTLARDGATLVVVDVPPAGESLAKVANAVGGTALQLDITAPDAGERILEHALTRHGRLDIVVHNAGVLRDKLLANMTPEKWDPVLAVNIAAQLRMNEALLAASTEGRAFADAPRIVSLASTSGIAGNRGQTNYGASKAGVIGMVQAWADRFAEAGGTINAVAPGFIETDMTAKIPPLTRQVARRLSSLQQGGQPVDVAEAIAFLASPQAGGINGQVLRVCGQNMVGA